VFYFELYLLYAISLNYAKQFGMFFCSGKLFILQRYIQNYLLDNLPLKIKVDVRYTIMVPYHILIVCKTFPRRDISNALLLVIVRLLVVSAKFLFRTANIVLTSRRAAEQAGNAKEPVRDQYQDGGLLYLLALISVRRAVSGEMT